jgi:transposase
MLFRYKPDIFTDIPGIKHYFPQAVPVVLKLCRLAGIASAVDRMARWNESNSVISPGLVIESLVTCIMCNRKPLWRVHEFWAGQDLALLFPGVELSSAKLNDDACGHSLDKLAEIDRQGLISACCLTMLQEHDLDILTSHFDTTSISVQGAYEGEPYGDFDVCYGNSKDKRPDLKQFMIGAGVQQDGLPIMGRILAGNTSDKRWNPEAALEMKKLFSDQGFRDIIFVSDCATVSTTALENLTADVVQFISRLPENFNLAGHLKETAFAKDRWRDLGALSDKRGAASYRTYAAKRKIGNHRYDFLVVQSSALEKRKEKTLKKRLAKQQESLSKVARELSAQSFACVPDAARALKDLQDKASKLGFATEGGVETFVELSYPHKGRPRKGEEPIASTTYRTSLKIGEIAPERYQRLCQMESTFVLISSIKKELNYDDRKILTEYKHQSNIEQRFRFIKSPVYLGPVYLHNKSRINALGFVFILVLLIASYLEYRVRQNIKKLGVGVYQPGTKPTETPSTKTIMGELSLVRVDSVEGKRTFPRDLNLRGLDIVVLAGFDPGEIYLKPLPLVNAAMGP